MCVVALYTFSYRVCCNTVISQKISKTHSGLSGRTEGPFKSHDAPSGFKRGSAFCRWWLLTLWENYLNEKSCLCERRINSLERVSSRRLIWLSKNDWLRSPNVARTDGDSSHGIYSIKPIKAYYYAVIICTAHVNFIARDPEATALRFEVCIEKRS